VVFFKDIHFVGPPVVPYVDWEIINDGQTRGMGFQTKSAHPGVSLQRAKYV
jgi:hypothetical protein